MKKIVLLLLISVGLISCYSHQESKTDSKPNTAQRQPATVQRVMAKIQGYDIHDYPVQLEAGKLLNVGLASKNRFIYFNILPPNSETTIFNGSINGLQFERVVQQSGEYRVRVYLMRSEARRNGVAEYGLEIIHN